MHVHTQIQLMFPPHYLVRFILEAELDTSLKLLEPNSLRNKNANQ